MLFQNAFVPPPRDPQLVTAAQTVLHGMARCRCWFDTARETLNRAE